jgi:serine/threonine protein kinase
VPVRIGDVVAERYRLDATVGAGGMGVVWRATDLELRRVVAVKQATAGDTRREARIGAGLQHPNVITVFDVIAGEGDTRLLVMEYLPSRTLAQALRDDGPLPPDQAAHIGAQIAAALDAMHAKGMVHRDITPANILVAEDGTAKLTDLGIAMWDNVTVTGSAQAPGTPGYIAPEVLAGQATTAASDMYTLGITLSAAVEGAGGQDTQTSWLGIVLSALTHSNPKRRPTAARAREMLLEISTNAPKPRRRISRRTLTAAGVVLVVAVVVAGVLVWWPFTNDGAAQTSSLVGNPRTVDPCGFIDETPLKRFGKTQLERDFGEFNRCDVWVSPDGTDENESQVFVTLETSPESDEGTWNLSLQDGPIRPVYPQPEDNHCKRIVLLPGRYRVEVTAIHDDGVPGDLCAMADALFSNVLSVVYSGHLPRRAAPDSTSIASLHACDLMRTSDLDRVLGARAVSQDAPQYGDWSCSWTGPQNNLWVSMFLVRDWAPSSGNFGDVTEIAGREAAVDSSGSWGENTCMVRVVYRPYTSTGLEGEDPQSKTEQIRVEVTGAGKSMAERCANGKRLAEAAANRLPK